MLSELRVSALGVIDDVHVVLGPGMTALTGETGTGKTLVVEAIELLLGGRTDPVLVRPRATEALVEGRFVGAGPAGSGPAGSGPAGFDPTGSDDTRSASADDEVVLRRVVPARGRSRAYVDGQMVASSVLADVGGSRVDLHGQHRHQSLLAGSSQRAGLDAAGGISDEAVLAARSRLRQLDAALDGLGGDARSRARELDLLTFQLAELDGAALEDPDEDGALQAEEVRLADATAQREAAEGAHLALTADDGVLDRLGQVTALLTAKPSLAGGHERLSALAVEMTDVARDLRREGETLIDDPERLAAVGDRRWQLAELRRKYGDTLEAVMAYRETARARHAELEGFDARAEALEAERSAATVDLASAEAALGAARRGAAPAFGAAVAEQLQRLAMPRARFEVQVSADPAGQTVTWLLGANPGEPALPLAKVASGGELARTMLAARLVLGSTGSTGGGGATEPGPARTLVFDEVDAGVGGEAAVAVGRALAELASHHQVLVVTHLPQVAAFATDHLVVRKWVTGDETVTEVAAVSGAERVVELSRMLSGQPGSDTARRHAEELLAIAGSGPRAG